MFIFKILFIFYSINLIVGYPASNDNGELTPGRVELMKEWSRDNGKQNVEFEGDMVIRPGQRHGILDPKYRWRNKIIPYDKDDILPFDVMGRIRRAIAEINTETCLNIRPKLANDTDYVTFRFSRNLCHSEVGRQGGQQFIGIQFHKNDEDDCDKKGQLMHVILHAVGFYHMENDPVRDDWVTINHEYIRPGCENQFKKYNSTEVTSFGEVYDYDSIMHSKATHCSSKYGKLTIVPKRSGPWPGQRRYLSESDKRKVRKMYDCPSL